MEDIFKSTKKRKNSPNFCLFFVIFVQQNTFLEVFSLEGGGQEELDRKSAQWEKIKAINKCKRFLRKAFDG